MFALHFGPACKFSCDRLCPLQPFSQKEVVGFVIGSISSVLYLLSRVPQIYTNVRVGRISQANLSCWKRVFPARVGEVLWLALPFPGPLWGAELLCWRRQRSKFLFPAH